MVQQVWVQPIDVESAYMWQKYGIALLIDVREESEYTSGMIQKAILHPFSTFDPSFLPYVDPVLGLPQRLVFFCQEGLVAPEAARCWGKEIGAAIVFFVEGGIDKWVEEELPLKDLGKSEAQGNGAV